MNQSAEFNMCIVLRISTLPLHLTAQNHDHISIFFHTPNLLIFNRLMTIFEYHHIGTYGNNTVRFEIHITKRKNARINNSNVKMSHISFLRVLQTIFPQNNCQPILIIYIQKVPKSLSALMYCLNNIQKQVLFKTHNSITMERQFLHLVLDDEVSAKTLFKADGYKNIYYSKTIKENLFFSAITMSDVVIFHIFFPSSFRDLLHWSKVR